MRLIHRPLLFSAVLLLGIAASAKAQATWTLQNVTLSDGGTASGSFTFDAGTNSYTNISITTTTGSLRTGATYTILFPLISSGSPVLLLVTAVGDLTGTPLLILVFSPPLTNAGGVVNFANGVEETCLNSACSTAVSPFRFLTGGSVNGTVVCPDDYASWWFWYVEPPCSQQVTDDSN